jgi:hypothetical protein
LNSLLGTKHRECVCASTPFQNSLIQNYPIENCPVQMSAATATTTRWPVMTSE